MLCAKRIETAELPSAIQIFSIHDIMSTWNHLQQGRRRRGIIRVDQCSFVVLS
jgi:hypothetical protein